MSRTTYMEEVSFRVADDLESWEINQLWGRYIEQLLRSQNKDYDVNHLGEYRFEASEADDNVIYVTNSSTDSCFGGLYLAQFIAAITTDMALLEFYDGSTERWGYYVTPGLVRNAEYNVRPGTAKYQVTATPDGIIVNSVGEGEV